MYNIVKKLVQHGTVTVEYPKKNTKSTYITGIPEFDYSKCTRCKKCISVCPTGAVVMTDKDGQRGKFPDVNADECIFCRFCEEACSNQAVSLSNKFELAQKSRELLRAAPLYVGDKDVNGIDYELIGKKLNQKIGKKIWKKLAYQGS